jgi:hypothetical protein
MDDGKHLTAREVDRPLTAYLTPNTRNTSSP